MSSRRRASRVATDSSRKLVAVGIDRLSFMLATSLAAGPVIGTAPGGTAAGVASAGRAGAEVAEPLAAGVVPLAGRPSLTDGWCPLPCSGARPGLPVWKYRRHSSDTAAGSRRNSSYMIWAKPAFAVSNTFGSTDRSQPFHY